MLDNQQIKLIQTAVKAAGLRTRQFEGRYRMLLAQYTQPSGKAVTSCKQLNNSQLEDMLAICEAHGFRMPGKPENHFRFKVATESHIASFAQQSAIKHLAGDLGWDNSQLAGMLKRMTGGFVTNTAALKPGQAYNVIESLKAIVGREKGKHYSNLKQIEKDYMEVARDGETNQV